MIFGKYPWTDFHDLNLDWLVDTVKNIINDIKSLFNWTEQHEEDYKNLKEIVDGLPNIPQKWILVGDSFGESPSIGQDWESLLVSYLADRNITSYMCHLPGGSFGNLVKYQTALESLTVPNPEEITDILVAGGYNDVNVLPAMYNGMNNFINFAKSIYPNAKIHYAPFCLSYDYYSLAKTVDLRNWAMQCSETLDIDIVSDAWLIFRDYSTLGGDKIHPTAIGSELIAKGLLSFCLTRNVFTENNYGQATFEYDDTIIDTNTSTLSDYEFRSYDDVNIEFNNIYIKLLNSTSFVAQTKIATITTPKYITGQWEINIPVTGYGMVNGVVEFVNGVITINGGNVYLIISSYSSFDELFIRNSSSTIPMTIA